MSCYIDAVRNFTVKRFTCSGGICNISGNSEDTVILGTYTSPTPSQDWGIRNYSIMSIADDCKAVFGKFEPNNATNSTRMIIDNRPGRPLETYARKAEIPATDGGLIKTCTYTGTSSTPNYTLAVDDVTGIPNPIPKGYKLTLICSTALTRRTNYLSIPGILEGVTLAVKTNFLPGATSTTGIAVPVNTPFNVQLVNSGSTNYWIYQDLPIISLGSAGAVNGTLPVGYGGTGRTSYTANQLVRAGTSGTAALVNDIALSTTMPDAPTDLMVPSTKLLKTAVDGVGTDLHTNYRTTSDTDTYVNQQIADASLNTFKREYDGEVGIGVDVIPSGDAPSVTASNGDRYFTLAYNNDPDGLPIGWIIICWEYENGSWGFSSTLLPIAATDLHWVAVEKDSDIEGYYVIKTGEDEDSLPKWELLGSGAALVGDNDTIEITGDVISVKTGGIMADQIAEFSVGTSKLAMESITEDRLDPDLADKVNSNGMLMKIATGTIDDMVIDADGFPDPIPYGYRFLLKLPTFTVETSPYLTVTGLIPKTRVGNVYLNNPNTYTNNYASPKLSNIYVLVNYTRIINNNVFTILEDSYINVQAGVGKVTGILDKYNGGIGIALNPGSPGLLTNVDNFTEKMKITPLVTEVSDTSTDSEVPTAKAVQTAIDAIPTPSGGGLLIKEGTVVQSQNPPKWTITISDTSGFPNPIPNGYEFILICDYTFAGFRYNKYHFITIPSIAEDIPTMITPVDGNSGYYGFMGANPNVPIHLRYRNTGTTTAWQFVDEHYINLSYSNPQIKFEGYLPLPWGGTGLNAVPTTPSVVMSDSTVSTTAMQYRALLDGDIADNPESDAIPNVRQVAEYVQQLLNN
jgi:hypothetical protein